MCGNVRTMKPDPRKFSPRIDASKVRLARTYRVEQDKLEVAAEPSGAWGVLPRRSRSALRPRSPAQAAEPALAGDRAARQAGGLRRRKERALLADRERPAAPQPPALPAGQGPGRDLAPRLRPGRGPVQGRRAAARELLRLAPRVLALGRRLDRRGPERRGLRARDGRSTSTPWAACRCWRRSIAPKPVGHSRRQGRPGQRVGSRLRLRGAAAGPGRRGARAPRRRSRAGHEPRQLGEALLLQVAHVRQRGGHGDASSSDWLRDHNTRTPTELSARRRPSCSPRSASACGRCRRRSARLALRFPVVVGPRATSSTTASRTRCRPSRWASSARSTSTGPRDHGGPLRGHPPAPRPSACPRPRSTGSRWAAPPARR